MSSLSSERVVGASVLAVSIAAAMACGGSKFLDGRGGAGSDASTTDGPVDPDGAPIGDGGADPCRVRARFCEAGACNAETFASTVDTSWAVAVFDGWVYWTTDKAVYRQPESGGTADIQKIASTGGAGPLVLDKDGLFWLERDVGKVMSCAMPIQGPCTPKPVATSAVGGNEALGMGLDKDRVYWTVSGGGGGAFGAPRGGGGQVIPYYDQSAQFIVADDKNVYIQTNCSGSFVAPKAGGGSPTSVTSMCTFGAGGLVMDSRAVYFGGVQITRVPRGTGAQATLSTLEHIEGLAEYCGDLHYIQRSTDGGGYLARIPTSVFPDTGGNVSRQALEVLLRGVSAGSIAVGASGIYWADGNDIMRLRRDP